MNKLSSISSVLLRLGGVVMVAILLSGCNEQPQPVVSPTNTLPTITAPPAVSRPATPASLQPTLPATSTTAPSAASAPPAGPAPTGTAPAVAVEPTVAPPPATTASCEPTAPDVEGPFYVPGAPERSSVGQGYVLSGVVRSSADCSPLAGVQLEFWLAGPNGQYDDDHRATMHSDSSGAYRFESNFPPPYSGRPSHIHLRITADGYQPLVTQYYPAQGQTEDTFDLVLRPDPEAQTAPTVEIEPVLQEYPIPPGSRPHDVAPASDGTVWYTAQGSGELGRLNPATGETRHLKLGQGSAPHGVIVGPDGAPWITDGGLNAIVRVDPGTEEVQSFPLPATSDQANLNTATFDPSGRLWFTGQNGVYGRLDPAVGQVEVFEAPRGRGPYGITTTPDGNVYYASLAGSHIARIDLETGQATPLDPPTAQQGARRVWSDSQGRIWVSEWNAGQLGLYDPATQAWREWPLPGDQPRPYAVYVDDQDKVWLSDFGDNALLRFDPVQETFEVFPLPTPAAGVRQILGRPGEIWGAESGADKLVVIRTAAAPEGQNESAPAPTGAVAAVPAPALFDLPWADRSVFRPGLIESEQAVLEQLPGASVYHLDLTIGDDLLHLQGREEVLYTNREEEPLAEVYFRLFPNLADGATTIQTAKVNNRAVEPAYELRQSAMRLPLSPALQPGEQVVIQLEFTVTVPNGEGGNYGTFAFVDGVLALAHFYPLIPVYNDEGWNIEIAPAIGDVVYADTSFYLVRVTAPVTQTLAASGFEIERQQTDSQQVVTFVAGPMRDFYLAASDDYAVTSRTVGQTTINSYAPARLASGAEAALDVAAGALESFNRRFGTYPFTEFDLVGTTTFALGVEYPGIVAILADLYEQDEGGGRASPGNLLEGVVAHEVAHQWFYSVVGNDQVDEPWLDEAMAQFATLLYYSDAYGPDGAAGFRASLQRRWDRVADADIPIGLPVRAYTAKEYGAIVYGRGPLFIETLAETLGQERFAAFLRDYYQTYQWGLASGDGFKRLAEQHCACDLTSLFEAWVYEQPANEG